MTVAHGPLSLYHDKISKLGPDPLREDADKEALWAAIKTSKKPIGLVSGRKGGEGGFFCLCCVPF